MRINRRSVLQNIFYTLMAALCLYAAAGCTGSPAVSGARDFSVPSGVRHLVFIGLDGWGAAYLSRAEMPTVKRMIAQGASAAKALNVKPTVSWPNWSSLFTGTAPEFRPESREDFPTIFTALNTVPAGTPLSGRMGAAFFYEWEPLTKICTGGQADKRRITSSPESAREIAAYIREKKPAFTAIVFDQPDSAGHTKNWGSRFYYEKLAELDGFIALFEEAVKDAGIYDNTVFVLSSDHGGFLWGHGHNLPIEREIPLVICGRGIKKGFVIPSPVSICDIAPTMAAALGAEPSPEWKGRILREIFE